MGMFRGFACALSSTVALAALSPAMAQDEQTQAASDEADIIVTANRREQRVQDVPSTIQVLEGDDLDQKGANGFVDYVNSLPAVSFRDQGNGANRITVRGISNVSGYDVGNGTAATTGLYLNDVPIQGASIAPDVALYDLDRVEVLKGPQGTLYGEGAMGGAIRMILNSPQFDRIEGSADLTLSSVNEGGLSYRGRGVINLPIIRDRVALRLVGTYLDESGFVDNLARNEENHDDRTLYSIRALLAARLNDSLDLEFLALRNDLDQDDFPQIEPSLGDGVIRSNEDRFNKVETDLFAATLKNDFGFATLTSVTSQFYSKRQFVDRVIFGSAFFQPYGPVTQDPYNFTTRLRSFSQELRLVSNGDKAFDWVVGAFYRNRRQKTPSFGSIAPEELAAVNAGLASAALPLLGPDGVYFGGRTLQTAEQYAVYAEGTLEIAPRLDLTVGLRFFDEVSETVTSAEGFSILSAFTSAPVAVSLNDSGVIPKFGISYKFSDRHLVYAQASKGFRSSSANPNIAFGGDEGAESDTLWSYEIGSKNTIGRRSYLNASAFYLDWKGIQSIAFVPSPLLGTVGVLENAGDAEVYGIEAELGTRLGDTLTVGATLGYVHSELLRSLGNGQVGSELPSSPSLTASGFIEHRSINTLGEVFARLEGQYVDGQNTSIVQINDAGVVINDGQPLERYVLINAQVGLELESGLGVSISLNNILDERAQLGRGFETLLGTAQIERFAVARPRTIALMISKRF